MASYVSRQASVTQNPSRKTVISCAITGTMQLNYARFWQNVVTLQLYATFQSA